MQGDSEMQGTDKLHSAMSHKIGIAEIWLVHLPTVVKIFVRSSSHV